MTKAEILTQYNLTKPSPAQVGDVVKAKGLFWQILDMEPLYYKFQNLSGGVDQGMSSQEYPVTDLVPSPQYFYYLQAWGINGDIEVQIRYQSGQPRNTTIAKQIQRLNRLQAGYLDPFSFKICMQSSDTINIDVLAAFAGVLAEVWFYGWKWRIRQVSEPVNYVDLEDVK